MNVAQIDISSKKIQFNGLQGVERRTAVRQNPSRIAARK
jgi:hypothetical protein